MDKSGPAAVSLCMIVKNEERNLRPCLEPVADLFPERVIIDTGSSDGTRRIAAEFGTRLAEWPWADDFSAARNHALEQAGGDWIFWLDADDRVDRETVAQLRNLFGSLGDETKAFVMNTVCVPQHAADSATVISQARLFRRHPAIRWEGRVHEQILPSVQRLGHELVWTDMRIQHVGYQDSAMTHRKANRDLRLLRLEYAVRPHDPVVLYNLGLTHARLGQFEAALPYLQQSLERVRTAADWVRKLMATLCDVWMRLSRPEQALTVTALGLQNFPHDPELSLRRADLLGRMGNLRGAEQCLQALLASPETAYLKIGVADQISRREARRLLAVVHQDQGRLAEAQAELTQLLAESPDFVQAWVNLGYVFLAGRQFAQVDAVIRSMERCPDGDVYAAVMRAEQHLACGEPSAARPLLEMAVARAPRMLWPRLVLSDWLLKQGDDMEGFRAVQRDILRLDPGNAQARANLERRVVAAAVPSLLPVPQLSWSITV